MIRKDQKAGGNHEKDQFQEKGVRKQSAGNRKLINSFEGQQYAYDKNNNVKCQKTASKNVKIGIEKYRQQERTQNRAK